MGILFNDRLGQQLLLVYVTNKQLLKMKRLIGLSFLIVFLAMGCCNNEGTTLELHFKLEYGGEDLVMFEDVEYPNGMSMFFNRFSFYISDLNIQNQIQETRYLNLTESHADASSAAEGYVWSISGLEGLEINNISFNIGLDSDVNATLPSDYNSRNDLSLSSEYWTPWDSYIFSKTEGRLDTDGDGQKELGIALHLGLDEAFRSVSLPASISLTEGESADAYIIIDLKQLFESSNGIYDIVSVPQIHQTNTMNEINELADNMVNAISIR